VSLLLTECHKGKSTVKIFLVIICFIAAGLSLAQTTDPARPPHGLVIRKLTWSRIVSPPKAAAPRQDEVSGPPRRDNPQADPVDKLRTPSPFPGSPLPNQGKLPDVYVYSLEVKNVGEKKVRGVFWDYVAADQASGAELNRRRFISIQGISPGRVATLSARFPSPPTNLVTAGGLEKDQRSPFTSSAEIRCVLYADDMVWEAGGGDKACAELRLANAQARARKGR
jgi:hypothetical protein